MTRVHRASISRGPAVAGLVSIALGLVAVVVDRMWSFPTTAATAQAVATFVADRRGALAAAMVLNSAAVALWLVFVAGVWSVLTSATEDRGDVALAVFGWATTAFVTLLLAGFTAFWLLIARSGTTDAAGLLYDLTFGLLAMSGVPTALALGAYAVVAARTRAFPRHTIRLAVLSAVAHLGLLTSFVARHGVLSLEGPLILAIPGTLFAWIGATALTGLRSGDA